MRQFEIKVTGPITQTELKNIKFWMSGMALSGIFLEPWQCVSANQYETNKIDLRVRKRGYIPYHIVLDPGSPCGSYSMHLIRYEEENRDLDFQHTIYLKLTISEMNKEITTESTIVPPLTRFELMTEEIMDD